MSIAMHSFGVSRPGIWRIRRFRFKSISLTLITGWSQLSVSTRFTMRLVLLTLQFVALSHGRGGSSRERQSDYKGVQHVVPTRMDNSGQSGNLTSVRIYSWVLRDLKFFVAYYYSSLILIELSIFRLRHTIGSTYLSLLEKQSLVNLWVVKTVEERKWMLKKANTSALSMRIYTRNMRYLTAYNVRVRRSSWLLSYSVSALIYWFVTDWLGKWKWNW